MFVDHLLTNDVDKLQHTIAEMVKCTPEKAFSLENLTGAMTKLPFETNLIFDKIFGRWIFTNMDRDDLPDNDHKELLSGANFCFVDDSPEIAISRAIHYYYYLRIKD